MATKIAPTFDMSMFDLVRLEDVFPDHAGDRALNVVEITVFGRRPSLSPKELKINFGDTVRWECRLEFRLKFHPGHSPAGPGGTIEYDSELDSMLPDNRAHFKQLVIKSDDWSSDTKTLTYDVHVKLTSGKWVLVDPKVIIDITRARVFAFKLKEGNSLNDVLRLAGRAKPMALKAKLPVKAAKAGKAASKVPSTRGK